MVSNRHLRNTARDRVPFASTLRSLALSVFLLVALVSAVAAKEQEPLPDFQTCLSMEVASFERNLYRSRSDSYHGLAHIFDIGPFDVCGVIGIILCDRGDDPLPCQHSLAEEQDTLRKAVLAQLPKPEDLGADGADPLYLRVWELAHGISAGDDCAGSTPVMAAWCEAREATRRLTIAILAYQLARSADGSETATALGWAVQHPPVRPRAREDVLE